MNTFRQLALIALVGGTLALTATAEKARVRSPAARTPMAVVTEKERELPALKLNLLLGMHVFEGSAFVLGTQLSVPVKRSLPIYLGAEFNFSLYSPAHLTMLLAGSWLDARLSSRLHLSMGVLAGPAFAEKLERIPSLVSAGFLDLSLAQEIDDLVSIRGQFRPGIVGRYFALMLGFNVLFRFY